MSLSSDSRPSQFTLQEFSDLVCSAFNISDADLSSQLNQPLLSLTPPSPTPSPPNRVHHLGSTQQTLPSALDGPSPLSTPRSRSGAISARRMFQQVRSRASALVLRSRESPASPSRLPSPAPYEPLPPPCPSPTLSASSFARALSPWSMVDPPASRPSSPSPSLFAPIRSISPIPLYPRQTQSYRIAGPRSPSTALRSFFDDTPVQNKRAYSRPATSASVLHPLSRITSSGSVQDRLPHESLPSFFEDTGYMDANPRPPSYCRPATPSSSTPIHSRLPPLRKAKSSGHSLLRRNSSSRSMDGSAMRVGFQDFALWNTHKAGNMPSPLTLPREPPPVPAYVYERRGSATSNSTGSTRSSSSLSTRLSHLVDLALPSKLRIRSRSKLNLDIASAGLEGTSADSSPSTLSSGSLPSTPSSPTSPFSRSQAQVYLANADDHIFPDILNKADEDALAIGRVLTPDADPFAKGDIILPAHGTPRQPTCLIRRASSQASPSSSNRVVTWDDQSKPHPTKRVRNSLPATPVSVAPTFPSSCSVYSSCSPESAYAFPARKSPAITPKRSIPPSAWPLSSKRPTTSPGRSPPQFALKQNYRLLYPTNGSYSALPGSHPPPFPPPSLPPPNRDLPGIPVPSLQNGICHSKDHMSRSHRSLPPSPRPIDGETDNHHNHGNPKSVRSSIIPLSLALQDRSISAHHASHALIEADFLPSLGEPWSGVITPASARPGTPVATRRVAKRQSTDSTSTVTASPCSSALHASPSPGYTVSALDGESLEDDFWNPRAS